MKTSYLRSGGSTPPRRLYAGRDDFKDFDELKERLSRARPKDSTLDYAQRRGLDTARAQSTEKEPSVQQQREQERRPGREQKEQGEERKPEAGHGDPIVRFKQAQKEFIQVAGLADFDPKAKARSVELREEMKRASQEIAKDPARMRVAEHKGFAPQVRNFVRQAERERGREKGRGSRKTKGWRDKVAVFMYRRYCLYAYTQDGTQHPE